VPTVKVGILIQNTSPNQPLEKEMQMYSGTSWKVLEGAALSSSDRDLPESRIGGEIFGGPIICRLN
jgi:hypothetical protein